MSMSAAAGDPEETTKVAPKSNKEALEFACDGYAGSLSISPAARRKVEEVRAASPKSSRSARYTQFTHNTCT
jgi:hypothetical protein